MRNPLYSLGAVVLAVMVGCVRSVPEEQGGTEASRDVPTLYLAARVRTLDVAKPLAEALLVRGGKVVGVGGQEELRALAGPGARVVELKDATLVPGLVDAHGHTEGLGQSLAVVQLEGTGSRAEVLARLASAPASAFQGDWLLGQGWDQNDWPEKAFPDRKELDARWPDTPVALGRVDGHAMWVNGEALRRARINKETPDPAGGRILRGPDGAPTGVLVDNAMDLVSAVLPLPTEAQFEARLEAALAHLASVGLTGVHDAGMSLRTFRLLRRWDGEGKLKLRMYAMADGQGADRETYLREGPYQGRMLTLRSVKLSLDGALGSRGAALHQPYNDEPGHRGLLLLTPEEYEARARAFMSRGFQVGTHAIGDRANTLVLDTLLRASEATGTRGLRHRVEHAQVMTLEDIERMGRAGFVASMQPTHATSDMPWAEARVGPERIRGAYAWQRLKAAGAPLAFGSDFPVERAEPLLGLYAARTRQDASGQPPGGWMPDQRMSGQEALEGFTVGAAYASFVEKERGRLMPGMDADFVVLSVDPVDAPAPELLKARVLLTVVAGTEVYRAP